MPGAACQSLIVGVIDHFAQQIQHRDALGRVEVTHGQFADAGSMGLGVTHQLMTTVGQANDDFAPILRVWFQGDQVACLEPLDDASNGRLIHRSGLDQLGQ